MSVAVLLARFPFIVAPLLAWPDLLADGANIPKYPLELFQATPRTKCSVGPMAVFTQTLAKELSSHLRLTLLPIPRRVSHIVSRHQYVQHSTRRVVVISCLLTRWLSVACPVQNHCRAVPLFGASS